MKGIIKILEAIIASIILITTISFFINIERTTRWDTALFQTNVQDTLSSLDRSGLLQTHIRNYDKLGFESLIKSSIGKTTDFSLSIDGIPDSEIIIACNCTATQINDLKSILNITVDNSFSYKTRRLNITVNPASIENLGEEDILFIFGYKSLAPYETQINAFLEKDRTIFMFSSLTEAQVNDGIMNETFGLQWNSGLSDSTSGNFYPPSPLPENSSYRTAKYHRFLSGTAVSFGSFTSSKITADGRTIVIAPTEISHVKFNDKVVSGKGRAVWFADYNYNAITAEANNTDILMKASILFAAERFTFDPVPKSLSQKHFEYSYIATLDNDPFEIRMIAWRVFF
jgi:hypothetical protein